MDPKTEPWGTLFVPLIILYWVELIIIDNLISYIYIYDLNQSSTCPYILIDHNR